MSTKKKKSPINIDKTIDNKNFKILNFSKLYSILYINVLKYNKVGIITKLFNNTIGSIFLYWNFKLSLDIFLLEIILFSHKYKSYKAQYPPHKNTVIKYDI